MFFFVGHVTLQCHLWPIWFSSVPLGGRCHSFPLVFPNAKSSFLTGLPDPAPVCFQSGTLPPSQFIPSLLLSRAYWSRKGILLYSWTSRLSVGRGTMLTLEAHFLDLGQTAGLSCVPFFCKGSEGYAMFKVSFFLWPLVAHYATCFLMFV